MGAVAALEWSQTGGHVDEVVDARRSRALEGGELAERDPNLLTLAALLPMIVGDRDEALQIFDFAMLDAHRRGSLFAVTGMYLWRGFTLFWRGDLIDAEEELTRRLRPGRGVGLRAGHAAVERRAPLVVPDRARRPRRRAPGADARARSAAASPTARATGATRAWSCWSPRAATRTRSRRPRSTRRRFSRYHNPQAARWSSLRAVALDALGMKRKAIELAAEELDRARDWGAPGTVARSLRVLGLLEGAEGLERLEEAVEVVVARAVAARAGQVARRARRHAPARRPPGLRARAADPRARAGRGVRRRAPAEPDPHGDADRRRRARARPRRAAWAR